MSAAIYLADIYLTDIEPVNRGGLAALERSVDRAVGAIAIRACAELPATIEARIRDAKAATTADSILYRRALADAAHARGWSAVFYDRDRVITDATRALDQDFRTFADAIGKSIGPPWQAKHKLALAAALAARPRSGARK